MGTLLFFITLLFPQQPANGCGIAYEEYFGYSFIQPNILRLDDGFAPYFLDIGEIYDEYISPKETQILNNVQEWRERFCNKPSATDMHYVIYKAPIKQLIDLKQVMISDKLKLSYAGRKMSTNSFSKYLYRHKCFETVDYLIFAKSCEPHVVATKMWEDKEKDINAMMELIKKGKKQFLETKSYYFRLRYAYQIIRLAHYAKKYELTLELYDYLMPKIDNDPSLIEYWIMGHKAGALQKTGKTVEAAYLYSLVFANCPEKRESAIRSFKIKTDEEWGQCLLLCQNNRERATLYALRAHKENSQLITEMKDIYQLDPLNSNLESLALGETKRLEKDLLGYTFNDKKKINKKYFGLPRKVAGENVIQLLTFVQQIVKEKKTKRQDFWKILEGYLEVLSGDYYYAKQSFEKASHIVTNDTLKYQLKVFELALEINAWDKITPEVEERIVEIKKDRKKYLEKNPDFDDMLRDKMAWLYHNNGDEAKAFLCYNNITDLRPNPVLTIVNDLLDLTSKKDITEIEKLMITKADGTTIRNDVIDMKANYFLSTFQLEKALEIYKKMPDETYWDKYGLYNPFAERIIDCVNCPIPDSLTGMNKGDMMRSILNKKLESVSEMNKNKAAQLNYEIGLAFYNMTYFSYAWKAMDYYRSDISILSARKYKDAVFPTNLSPYGNKENFDCREALKYFNKARILTTNPELGAKAAFMAAKCEQNDYYVNGQPGAEKTHDNFAIIVDQFSDTRFYGKLINECRYFNTYVNKLSGGE